MKTSAKTLLITAAMTGLLSASVPGFASAHASTTQDDNIDISKTSAKSGTRLLLADDRYRRATLFQRLLISPLLAAVSRK